MNKRPFSDLMAQVREKRPLVHHITNYVTVNDCANITLCAGGAPVMADAPEEVKEMAAVADALVLNIGTLNGWQVESMLLAGEMANDRGIPVILDPVGAGATRFRTATSQKLLDRLEIAVLKGNAGEIAVLAGAGGSVRGVDSQSVDGRPAEIAKEFAKAAGLTVAVSGATDIVTDGSRVLFVDNGHPMMGQISGSGCMASSVIGVFNAVSGNRVTATAAAFAAFGIAGEKAAEDAGGPWIFKTALFDKMASMAPGNLKSFIRIR